MCEYCEGAKPIIGDDQDGACIEQGNVLHSYGECTEFAEGKINFCPMCGRKLEANEMQENVTEYKSIKSNSTYTVTTENGRAYLGVTGEAATNPKVIAEKERIRKSGGDDVELVKWIARKLANTY